MKYSGIQGVKEADSEADSEACSNSEARLLARKRLGVP